MSMTIYKIHEQSIQKNDLTAPNTKSILSHTPQPSNTCWSNINIKTPRKSIDLPCMKYPFLIAIPTPLFIDNLARCFIAIITSDHEVVWYFFAWYKTLGKGMLWKFLLQHQCLIIIIIVQKNLFSSLFYSYQGHAIWQTRQISQK